MDAPLYNRGDIVYLRESAALGFLEAMIINTMQFGNNDVGWLYTVVTRRSQLSSPPNPYRSNAANAVLYFSESELVPVCDAIDLVEANMSQQLQAIQAQKAALCATTG